MRSTFHNLVTEGLGYCCLYAFFKWGSKATGLIAERLGVTDRCVRYNKARYKAGECKCEHRANCLRNRFSAVP